MKTILIVDDSPEIRECLRAALEMHGYKVLEAAYLLGVEAMALCNSDVLAVVLDGNVPFADGQHPTSSLPLALRLRAAGMRVVFHSGDRELNREAREYWLTVVEKGSSMKAVLEAVERD